MAAHRFLFCFVLFLDNTLGGVATCHDLLYLLLFATRLNDFLKFMLSAGGRAEPRSKLPGSKMVLVALHMEGIYLVDMMKGL